MTILNALFFIGRPFSPLYGMFMSLRSWLYSRKVLPVSSFPVPVISIGNLTMGGTGKTPTVQMISKLLLQNGYRPAVISRGYGGTANKPINVVATEKEILLGAPEAGDEPFLLASSIAGLPVVTGKKRALPCRYACDHMRVDTIILDDGFQHLGVKRDLDIVLFNATTLAGNSRVFPGGELREPVNALKRADAFLLTGITPDNQKRADAFITLLQKRFSKTPVFTSTNRVSGIFRITGEAATQEDLRQPLFAFCGIAHPERFLSQLDNFGIHITGNANFKDHAIYRKTDLSTVFNNAVKNGATGFITTQKDSVKLTSITSKLPLFYMAIEAVPSQQFIDFIIGKLSSLPRSLAKK